MYMRSENASKGSDAVLPVWDTPARFLQQVEKYDSDSSGDCREEEVGDEEEEDGRAASKCTIRFGLLQTFSRTAFSALMLRLRHPFGLIVSFAEVARQLLEFELSSVDARFVDWFAVELVGGMCVSLRDGWRALLGKIACAAVGGLGAAFSSSSSQCQL